MAALSALLLALGVGRHYVDVWQHRDVRGVSFMFVSIDAMGDLTSLLSLCTSFPFVLSISARRELMLAVG